MNKKALAAVFSAFLLVTGCSNSEESKKEEQKQESEIAQNEELTEHVVDEEAGILDGQVSEQDGMVIGTLVLGKKVSDEDAKELAGMYAEELKEDYKDKKVSVQAVRDGENVVNITKE